MNNKFSGCGELLSTIEKLMPTVLFEGETTTTATLSESVSNFKKIRIYWVSGDNHRKCDEVFNNGVSEFYTSMWAGSFTGTTYYGKSGRVHFNGTSLSLDRLTNINHVASANNMSANTSAVKVLRVEGIERI